VIEEDTMRFALIAAVIVGSLLATTVTSFACPAGYVSCGKFCCPK
jgi:hypothetical protein